MTDALDVKPPHSLEHEMSLLGSLLLDSRQIENVVDIVQVDAFYQRPHREIYGCLVAMHEAREVIDTLTVSEALKRKGKLEEAGGFAYLTELCMTVPSAVNARYYAEVVQDYWVSRQTITLLSGTINRVLEGTTSGAEALKELVEEADVLQRGRGQSKENELAGYDGPDKVISFPDMRQRLKDKGQNIVKANSLLPSLDDLIGGFEGGELIIVSGKPASGKSLLLQTFTMSFLAQGIGSLWFSYELTARQFLDRFPDVESLRFCYMPAELRGRALPWLEDRMVEALTKYHIQVVMLDHLHYLVDFAKMRNSSIEVGTVLRGLKTIAVKHNLIVFLIAHLTKVPDGVRPKAGHVRDSSFVIQEPDTVLMIWRVADEGEEEIGKRAKLSVEKARRTGVLEKTVTLIKRGAFLVEETRNEI